MSCSSIQPLNWDTVSMSVDLKCSCLLFSWAMHIYTSCHASETPSDAHKQILKSIECGRKAVCRGAPFFFKKKTFQPPRSEKKKKHTRTNQLKDCTKSGLSLLRDRCRVTSMRNLTMTLPPPPPPPEQSFPLLPNYYCTLKPTSVTIKLRGGWGLWSCTEHLRLFLKAKPFYSTHQNELRSVSVFTQAGVWAESGRDKKREGGGWASEVVRRMRRWRFDREVAESSG